MTYNFVFVNNYYTMTVNLFKDTSARKGITRLSPELADFALHTVTFVVVSFIPVLHEAGLLRET